MIRFEGSLMNPQREKDQKRREFICYLIYSHLPHFKWTSHVFSVPHLRLVLFVAISLLFTVRGVCTVLHVKRPAGGDQTEGHQPARGLPAVKTKLLFSFIKNSHDLWQQLHKQKFGDPYLHVRRAICCGGVISPSALGRHLLLLQMLLKKLLKCNP